MEAEAPVDLGEILLCLAGYSKLWARNLGRSLPDSPGFPGIL
jgi:hypothetical protein